MSWAMDNARELIADNDGWDGEGEASEGWEEPALTAEQQAAQDEYDAEQLELCRQEMERLIAEDDDAREVTR